MERNFENSDFENFLRQNADDLRMRPSEKVWQGISNDLHKRRRRIGWGLSIFFITACTLGYFNLDHHPSVSRSSVAQNQQREGANTQSPAQVNQPTLAFRNEALIAANPVAEGETQTTSRSRGRLTAVKGNTARQQSSGADNLNEETNETVAKPFEPGFVDSDVTPGHSATQQEAVAQRTGQQEMPPSIESVVNLYRPQKAKKKITTQFYFTPTMSYRRLTENKSYLQSLQGSVSPNAVIPAHYDVNEIVTHKPGMGLEMGMTAKYPISKKMNLRMGLQMNVTRYEIKAYNTNTELATIMLNSSVRGGADSMYRTTNISTKDGYETNWLQNLYFQVSAPVGIEFNVFGNDKVQFGVATTIQPTYVLSDKAYLISADYRKYAEVPELTRRWNVNTAFETYVAYSTGKLAWQVGPQVRYQLLSSFATKYPVKENLFDFGLRVGVSLSQRQ
jgi:hypothetical protein